MSILKKILAKKRQEILRDKKKVSLEALMRLAAKAPKARGFKRSLLGHGPVAVIAEIKRRSPSKGIIRKQFDPVTIARQYAAGGAAAISVLTDETFFGGSLAILTKVKKAVRLPILRKDFIIDPYQVYQAKAAGADAILLIAAALPYRTLAALSALAKRQGLEVLVEVHSASEMKKVAPLKPALLGVNNRDLRSFVVDLAVSKRLSRSIPKGALFVSESGIETPGDLKVLKKVGVRAVLVGESLMRAKNAGAALKSLLGEGHDSR